MAQGVCPKCKEEWNISEMEQAGYSCPKCNHQLNPGSSICVLSAIGKVFTPCTLERAEQEVSFGRAVWESPDTIRLLYSPELKQKYRRNVFKRDQRICLWCGGLADTVDHIIPNSKGGMYHPLNLMCSCRHCNYHRGDRDLPEHLKRVKKKGKKKPLEDLILERYDTALQATKILTDAYEKRKVQTDVIV